CPVISVSGGDSVPTLVSVGGIVFHHWCQWGDSVPSLVSVGEGIVPHCWCQWGWWNSAPSLVSEGGRNSAPSLESVGGGIVPHLWCQWGVE
ncbi:unnamed protein product, partial [Staurois parvus]